MVTVLQLTDFGAVPDAMYFNEADNEWYADENFSVLATDNTDAFYYAFDEVKKYPETILQMPAGGLKVLKTLWVPSNVKLRGRGMSKTKIHLGRGNRLDKTLIRWDDYIQPIICTTSGSGQIEFKGFSVWAKNQMVTSEWWGLGGILLKETEQIKVHGVGTSHINIFDVGGPREWAYDGWAISTLDCHDVEYYRCFGEFGGYQNFGFFDRTTKGVMHECFSGMGRRTSTQVHRDCTDIKIFNNVIKQVPNKESYVQEPHAAVTVHGEDGEEARDIVIQNNDIELPSGFKAAIQAFRQSENIKITHNKIKSNAEGINLGSADGGKVEYNEILALPNSETLHLGHYGIGVTLNTKNTKVRYNNIKGFDEKVYTDSTIGSDVLIEHNKEYKSEIHPGELYKKENGDISKVESFINHEGDSKKVTPYIYH